MHKSALDNIYSFINWPESGASPYIHWSLPLSQSIASPGFQSVYPSEGQMTVITSGNTDRSDTIQLPCLCCWQEPAQLLWQFAQPKPLPPSWSTDCQRVSLHIILSTPEALSIAINPVEGLNDNVMLIEVLLQLIRLGCDAALLLPHIAWTKYLFTRPILSDSICYPPQLYNFTALCEKKSIWRSVSVGIGPVL